MAANDSARGVFGTRRRQPDEPAYAVALGHERFNPRELLDQAIAAEAAGFDAICASDHLAPWWAPGDPAPAACGNAWVWLGAAGQATSRVALGTGVTALVHRYNPVVVAQQVATMESLYPGRAFLGVGSGESMNEVPAGMEWPSVGEQLRRTEEALTIIGRLLDGKTVDFEGSYFRTRGARLYLENERRPPVYMSAFGPQAAGIAGRLSDGLWTLADPEKVPSTVAAYRAAAAEAGREPGEVILQASVGWGETDDAVFEGAKEWKGTMVDAHYTDDIPDPARIGANGRDQISDADFKASAILSADPDVHVREVRKLQELGATAVVLMNVSSADPLGTLRVYGEHVLPALRGR